MKRKHWLALAGTLAVLSMTGCTSGQITRWMEWHNVDPAAAEAFAAQPEIQSQLQQQTAAPAAVNNRGGVWDDLAWCESGGNWGINTGNGYSGGLQFLNATWNAYGGQEFAGRAHQASREAQITVAERVLADVGWGAWPACARRLGLR